jgi:hypothetical protein
VIDGVEKDEWKVGWVTGSTKIDANREKIDNIGM